MACCAIMTANRMTIAYGNEPLLVDRAVADAVVRIRSVEPSAQRVTVEAATEDGGRAIENAAAPTLFGDATILIVTGIDSAHEGVDAALRDFAQTTPPDAWLICTHPGGVKGKNLLDALKKAGAVQVDCAALKRGKATVEFLQREFTSYKRRITPEGLSALYDAVGQDLRMLTSGISQLVSDVENEPIQESDVRAYFAGVAGVTGFAVADSFWDRRPVDALRSLRQALQESDGISVPTVIALSSGLRGIVRVAGMGPGASDADAAREAGVPPWKVGDLRRQWSRWSGDQRRLAATAVALADADGAVKGGVAEGSSLDQEQKLLELERLMMLSAVTQRA